MDRAEFVAICDSKVKLVRVEHGFSQEKMASVLGLSKKTLVEIEKSRRTLGWMGSVVLCTIFIDSEVLSGVFGGTPTDIILALAFEGRQLQYRKTSGGLIWWSTLMENEYYIIQQNILSQHYRLLDREGRRIVSSFDIDDLLPIFGESRER